MTTFAKLTFPILGVFCFAAFLISAFPAEGASAGEIKTMKQWTENVFFHTPPASTAQAPAALDTQPGLRVLRQVFGTLEINESVVRSPLILGTTTFAHGLGVNSTSEIEVVLPPGVQRFQAQVGVDNNQGTQANRGSVAFVITAGGKELYRSPILHAGMEPTPVSVDLSGQSSLLLTVTDGGDGPFSDEGDWADATLTLDDGRTVRLDELPVLEGSPAARSGDDMPFSFSYGGKSSDLLLRSWPRTVKVGPADASGKSIRTITWTDPVSKVEVSCQVTEFSDAPATDWMVRITNKGATDTPLIENFQGADMVVPLENPVLRTSNGSSGGPTDFIPQDRKITVSGTVLSAVEGRSSQTLPFFNLFDKSGTAGYLLALGWSGQWDASFRKTGAEQVRLTGAQQDLRVKLKPGESIRSPRVLLVHYDGSDPQHGQNLLRQVLLAHYVPRLGGKIVTPPIAAMTWFTFDSGSGVNEANQLESIATMASLGIEAYWLDAGWYGTGNWSTSVGSWDARPDAFPRGLKPLGDAAHAAGMKMIVWFEPERVQGGTTIAKEHPEFVHGGASGGLFKLDDPTARAWMTKLLNDHIRHDGIDILRIDFNIDPLIFWQSSDGPDQQGMTENQYVQGLYTMWDELRADNPGLVIDDCASGGRRIDLETVSRSIPFWRTDYACGGAHPASDQAATAGLSLWVPLNATGLWGFDPYTARSAATTGTVICADLRDKKFQRGDIERVVAEIKDLRELWLGDYYPLTPIDSDDSHWMAWQFDRADLGRGFAMVFRRPQVAGTSFTLALQGVDPAATYEVQLVDTGKTLDLTGKDLSSFQVDVPDAPGCVLLTYRKL